MIKKKGKKSMTIGQSLFPTCSTFNLSLDSSVNTEHNRFRGCSSGLLNHIVVRLIVRDSHPEQTEYSTLFQHTGHA